MDGPGSTFQNNTAAADTAQKETSRFTNSRDGWAEASWAFAHLQHRKGFISLVREHDSITKDNVEANRHYGCRVSIAEMQRMYLRALQMRLVHAATVLQTTEAVDPDVFDHESSSGDASGDRAKEDGANATPSGTSLNAVTGNLGSLLREYTQAVQDYEYMSSMSQKPFDYFIATSERRNDRTVIDKVLEGLDKQLHDLFHGEDENEERTLEHAKRYAVRTGRWEGPNDLEEPEPIGGTRNATSREIIRTNRLWRINAALLGAAFLIAPMWVLVLKRDLYLHLGLVTGFVTAFGLLMVWQVDSTTNVFAATLAYAAVLMVFVGVSLDKLFPD